MLPASQPKRASAGKEGDDTVPSTEQHAIDVLVMPATCRSAPGCINMGMAPPRTAAEGLAQAAVPALGQGHGSVPALGRGHGAVPTQAGGSPCHAVMPGQQCSLAFGGTLGAGQQAWGPMQAQVSFGPDNLS